MNIKYQIASGFCLESDAEKAFKFGAELFSKTFSEGRTVIFNDESVASWNKSSYNIKNVMDKTIYYRYFRNSHWSAA